MKACLTLSDKARKTEGLVLVSHIKQVKQRGWYSPIRQGRLNRGASLSLSDKGGKKRDWS